MNASNSLGNPTSWKRWGGAILSAVMAVGMLSACGSGSGSSGDKITIFNSKSEIQSQMEDMAKQYSKEKGVDVEVYMSADPVTTHLSTKYASNDPYTISMVDAKDVYTLAKDHAIDLSDQPWVKDTKYALSIDGKTYGFPVCVEARGLIYNADAIKKVTGKDFNPDDYKTLDEFKSLIQELKDGGMKSPTGVMKEDWSLAAHFLPQVYEEQKDPEAFIKDLQAGKVDLTSDAKFNALMDTFDVLKKNNYAAGSAISAEREVTEQNLAEGKIAFMFGGNWDWSVLNQYDYSKNMGIMPVPQNTDDGSNDKLVGGGSKFFFIDSSKNTSDKQRKEAKAFLTWLADSKEGQTFITKDASLVPAFTNNTQPVADPLGVSVKKYADADKLIPNFNFLPDDHYTKLGADFQKYLANQEDRGQFAKAIETYWKTAKLSGSGE
ncbi:ABC transporter substrate-binding protein [Bifidobacterium sp.]|uniref:ABC transporter substrate-binding protein n=1 Tax=Bifidobacterium sp. TaxID=41200 RepID=UPI0025C721AB|nr:ABC transporter substrate-binding protein [Bifidobacterium sp.]MCH4209794.1 ABC transporter substrate-binding protein [Bifidobacterium sp.]MCI1224585.1 ABC transporter substrate-binding protein [Bifidobacterium sp.]